MRFLSGTAGFLALLLFVFLAFNLAHNPIAVATDFIDGFVRFEIVDLIELSVGDLRTFFEAVLEYSGENVKPAGYSSEGEVLRTKIESFKPWESSVYVMVRLYDSENDVRGVSEHHYRLTLVREGLFWRVESLDEVYSISR